MLAITSGIISTINSNPDLPNEMLYKIKGLEKKWSSSVCGIVL